MAFFDLLHTFVTVAEQGSFSAAARSMGKAQSGVSTAISNLEIDLGVELFDRSSRTPHLTPEGTTLLREAEAALMHACRMKEHANRLCAREEESLTLGLDESLPYTSVADVFTRFVGQFPDVTVHIKHLDLEQTIANLHNGEVDLAIILSQGEYRAPIKFQRIGRLLLSEVVHHSHPLASRNPVTTGDLVEFRQLIYSRSLHTMLKQENLPCTRQWFCDNYGALVAMLLQGLGWAAIPNTLVKERLATGELVRLHHEMYPFTQWQTSIDLAWNAETPVGTAGLWLRSQLASRKICCA